VTPLNTATDAVLSIENLQVAFPAGGRDVLAANEVNLAVGAGEIVGLIGESGSGKSVTCRAVLGLVPFPGRVIGGRIRFGERDLLGLTDAELRRVRAQELGMIFQDPFSSLNPVQRVGDQLMETLTVNLRLGRAAARAEAADLVSAVGLTDARRLLASYPHELSGGMRQRIMIALATAARPRLLIADEPTTALDVTTQARILELLTRLRRVMGMAILLVSHDFGVIAETCDRVAVMYAGHIVEQGPVDSVYRRSEHPYTQALLRSIPSLASAVTRTPRQTIGGQPPDLADLPPGCPFAPRCPHVRPACRDVTMELERAGDHLTACPFVRSLPEVASKAAAGASM